MVVRYAPDRGIYVSTNSGASFTTAFYENVTASDSYVAESTKVGYLAHFYAAPSGKKSPLRVSTAGAISQNENADYFSTMRVAPVSPSVILMWTGGGKLWKSTDGGANFTLKFTAPVTGSFCSGFHYGDGVAFFSYVDTNATPRTQYHYTSLDQGETWTQITSNLPPSSPSTFSGNSFYLDGKHWAYLPHEVSGTGVYTSTNGVNWTYLGIMSGNGPKIATYGSASKMVLANNYYYALGSTTSGSTLSRSTDGVTWTLFGDSNGSFRSYEIALGVNELIVLGCSSTTSPSYLELRKYNFAGQHTNSKYVGPSATAQVRGRLCALF